MSLTTERPPPPTSEPPSRPRLAWARNTWRGLTSMRTALALLFLLALAALPGALLPQTSLNPAKVDQYKGQHPALGPILGRLGFFEVFASPWFAAIYLLLFVSLIGCLLPRSLDYARACRAAPVATPRNLSRMPHHAAGTLDDPPDEVLARVRGRLRGWRVAVVSERGPEGGPDSGPGSGSDGGSDGGSDSTEHALSAERGYLREVGNMVFHISLVGLLIAVAAGKLFGYEGQVIVLSGGDQFCNTGILGYDSFRAGARVDGTELTPFCVKVDDFEAQYLPSGAPDSFRADIGYQSGKELAAGPDGPWHPYPLEVNAPLRLDGDRVYLLGHGYAPVFTVTFPGGETRTVTTQWRLADPSTLLSEGASKIDRPGLADEAQRRRSQLAITGLLAPTSSGGKLITSVFPAPLRPEVAVDVLRGDLGLDDGRGQSIFEVDQRQVASGALTKVARANLALGASLTLDDGTQVRFAALSQWVSLQVSHDPGQEWVLLFAVLMLAGLSTSLTIKRRRFWVRLRPVTGTGGPSRTVVEMGGLARTDQAGYGEEFARLRAELLPEKTS
jgi:cytochrome c biogenesis protein